MINWSSNSLEIDRGPFKTVLGAYPALYRNAGAGEEKMHQLLNAMEFLAIVYAIVNVLMIQTPN